VRSNPLKLNDRKQKVGGGQMMKRGGPQVNLRVHLKEQTAGEGLKPEPHRYKGVTSARFLKQSGRGPNERDAFGENHGR